jgi:hypothetical protein
MSLEPMDYEEIRQVIARYCHAIDFQDLDLLVGCFAPGTGSFAAISEAESLTGKHTGEAELRAFGTAVGEFCEGHVRHSSISILIEGEGDRAWSRSYALITRDYGMPFGKGQTPFASIVVTGVYQDELVKIDGKWYFGARTFRYDGYPDFLKSYGNAIDIRKPLTV